jgi:hypothetical protein
MAIEQEAAWLRARVIQMRSLLRHVENARVENVLREFIADAETRLELLDEQARDQGAAPHRARPRTPQTN